MDMSEIPIQHQREREEILTGRTHLIGPESFPMPDRADTFARPLSDADQTTLASRREFGVRQAEAANDVLAALQTLEQPLTANDWNEVYETLTRWRSSLDAARLGQGVAQGRDRITTPITDESPNRDRVGNLGRLRAGATWSDEAQAWVGGLETPASRIVAEAGARAATRFDAEGITGDELQNTVHLPDGTVMRGNRIVRGEAAHQIALELKRGVAARGHDVGQFETGGEDMMFTITADAADRAAIFQAALQELTSQQPGQCTREAWANVAYLLYQSPQYKKGSDAVIRTFLVAAGTHLVGEAPILPQDIDLRAYISTQDEFVRYVIEDKA
jgi:hypothetical protein